MMGWISRGGAVGVLTTLLGICLGLLLGVVVGAEVVKNIRTRWVNSQ